MAEDISVSVKFNTDELKTGISNMQERINKSSLSQTDKNLNSAKLVEVTNILSKGVNMTSQDFSRASNLLRSITKTLVKAYADSEKVVKELNALEKKLEEQTKIKQEAKAKQSELTRRKIKVDSNTGEVKIRKAEIERLLKDAHVANTKGGEYKTADGVMKAAERGDAEAMKFMDTVKAKLDSYRAEYTTAKKQEEDADKEIASTNEKIDKLSAESGNPQDSLAVQMQTFGNELQNLIDKLRQAVLKPDEAPGTAPSGDSDNGGGGDSDEAYSAEEIEKVTTAQNKQNSSLQKAFKQFTLYAVAVRMVKKALNDAVKTIQDLDKYLTEQAMVTGKTRKETYALLKSYQGLAAGLGATTKEVAEVATQFMRQGKTVSDSLTLTTAAISAAKVAGISATESVNYLTTALNGFQLSAEQAMNVSDKFAAIAAQSATSYEEIATALSKVAAQANLAGMSIDYTTALLAKGIETTREAPETIGTALKTVIARMRELGDYGETLSGDTNINNVESQLQYVGIALRDTNGELRSTEDVLDELGKKWDTLNSNQQAAIAKALAGTRQQSRLIAMMNDYERVTELQEIAQRSQGATLAQMETYMEGMDAALNRVNVAWEQIVTTLANSDLIIGLINGAANLLDYIGSIMESTAGMVAVMGTVLVIGGSVLAQKIAEWETQKALNRSVLEEKLEKINTNIEEKKNNLEKKKSLKLSNEELIATTKKLIANKKDRLEAIARRRDDIKSGKVKAKDSMELARLAKEEIKIKGEISEEQTIINTKTAENAVLTQEIKAEEAELGLERAKQLETSLQIAQNGAGLSSIIGGMLGPLSAISSIMTVIFTIQKAIVAAKKQEGKAIDKNTNKEKKGLLAKASAMFASVVTAFKDGGIPGIIAGIALGAALAAAIGIAIAASTGALSNTSAEDKTAKEINAISNQIYKLNKQSQELATIEDKFDAIDGKVLKTNADLKEMSDLLDSAADKMDNSDVDDKEDVGYGKGVSQQEFYNSLQSNKERRDFLERVQEENDEEIAALQQKQINKIEALRFMNTTAFNKLLQGTSAESATARDAIYAINNSRLYDYIDGMKEAKDADIEALEATEKLTQAIMDEFDAYTAFEYAENSAKVKELAEKISGAYTEALEDGEVVKVSIAEVLTSDDYSVKDKTEAFVEMQRALKGNTEQLEAFNTLYNEFQRFADMGADVLDYIDKAGLTTDKLNDFYTAWSTIRKQGLADIMTEDQYQATFDKVLESLAATEGDVTATINAVYGSYLDKLTEGTDAYNDAYNALVNVMDKMLGETMLNIGQNMEKMQSSITSFYENAQKWSTMTYTEQTQFLSDNAELFAGEAGAALLKAFETGDYNTIQLALANNDTLKEQVQSQLEEVRTQLKIEEARRGDDYNAALVKYLKDLEASLTNAEELYAASLDVRLKQEQEQLSIYKEYLNKQKDALTESLDARKEAYQNYFDTINQESEDEDYEEQAATLVSNLSKLSSSSDQASISQSKELEAQLKALEEERLESLRQRAQEAVISGIEEQVDKISQQFDELLETDANILKALTGELQADSNFAYRMLASSMEGMTALQAQDYLQNTFLPNFGAAADLSNVEITKNSAGDTILNVAGRTINLNQEDSDSLTETLIAALARLGITI